METDKKLALRYDKASEAIKLVILQSQYTALQKINAVQLQLYYAVGRYISFHSRDGYWGTGALTYISRKLQQDLPGLHGFSETNLKMMRIFYEQWACLDSTKSSATADDFNAPQSGLEIISLKNKYLPVRRVRRFWRSKMSMCWISSTWKSWAQEISRRWTNGLWSNR